MYANVTAGDLFDNVFFDNVSDYDGGGAHLKGHAGLVIGNVFQSNDAGDDAGGLFLGDNSTADVYQNVFAENVCTGTNDGGGGGAGWGGGLLIHSSSGVLVHNNVVDGNTAEDGGGIFVYNSAPTVDNNTLFDNHSTSAGTPGGLRVFNGTYRNNIIWSGTGWGVEVVGQPFTGTFAFNDVFGWTDGNYAGTSLTGTDGNLSVNPQLAFASANLDWDDDVLTLQPGSVCRDAGTPEAAANDVDGSRNDMGAYGGPEGAW
jgi:parallel beta-helix repeat protein